MFYREYKRRSLIDRKELLVPIDTVRPIDDDDDEDVRRLIKQEHVLLEEQSKMKQHLLSTTDDEELDEESELKLINSNDDSETMLNFRRRYKEETDVNDVALVPKQTPASDSSFDMLSDSSSSVADDDSALINDLYPSIDDTFDGKQRIKIKGHELKVKGRPAKQRPKLMDAQFFAPNTDDNDRTVIKPSAPRLVNATANDQITELDTTSFDFLNDYDDNA